MHTKFLTEYEETGLNLKREFEDCVSEGDQSRGVLCVVLGVRDERQETLCGPQYATSSVREFATCT